MASSLFVNTLQVEFESVFAIEHTGMTRMFKSLEDTGLKGFLKGTPFVFENSITEFFVNAKVIAGTIVSTACNQKLVITEDMFSTTFKLPTEGIIGLEDITKETIVEMSSRFSATDVPFKEPSKKREIQTEYRFCTTLLQKGTLAPATAEEEHSQIGKYAEQTLNDYDWQNTITAETEDIKELVQRRSLLSYKLYELEVQKIFNENLAHFTNNVPSARHDFLCLRFLHKEFRHITSKHRDQRALTGLPTTVPNGLIIRATPVQSPLLAFEFSSLADQEQGAARTTIQQIVQQINENSAMTSPEHLALENEPQIEQQTNQAQPTTVDDQQTLEQQTPEDKDQSQTYSSSGSSWGLSADNISSSSGSPTLSGKLPDRGTTVVHTLGPNLSSVAKSSMDHQGPHSSTMPVVVYTTQNTTIDREAEEQPTFSAALEPLATPNLQFMDTTTKTLHTLTDHISSLDSQQNFTVLASTMVRNYADCHQQLVDELALVKSQLAEMVECMKELSDAQKGENNSRSKKSEIPSRRLGGEGSSSGKQSTRGEGPSGDRVVYVVEDQVQEEEEDQVQEDTDRVMIVKGLSSANGSRARAALDLSLD
ncbi:pollen-specific leucine-rich repeat extensin-like protein 2 [Dorcoceras hygrometricum]|uniref:Pollen-specific leucine-rich repeat extensin-like protein 2 n=1 Tax=Dorcoceras hygrometricum TaxID=472368 RepID=A0A2Z7C751_9LAMI|nr:pollen-specific leucine-rich repeat extensin-like protein 2 [Dorcoceras hygrometricum]